MKKKLKKRYYIGGVFYNKDGTTRVATPKEQCKIAAKQAKIAGYIEYKPIKKTKKN